MKKSQILNYLKSFDCFGQPISLSSEGSNVHNTTWGGLLTLLIAICVLLIGINLFYGLSMHNQLNTHTDTYFSNNPSALEVNKQKFPFAFGLMDGNYGFNRSIFSITLSYVYQVRINGTVNRTTTDILLKPCELSDFPGLEEDFIRSGINQFLCPSTLSGPIIGSFLNEVFSYYKFNVSVCTNGTNPYITCAPKTDIDKYIKTNSKIRIKMYFANTIINAQDYYKPIKKFIDEENWILSPGSFEIACDLFLSATYLGTDNNQFGFGDQTLGPIIAYNYQKDSQNYVPGDLSGKQYLTVFWRRSTFEKAYFRELLGISDILSQIGGFWNFLYLAIGFLAIGYNKFHFKECLANKIFDFDLEQNKKSKISRELKTLKTGIRRSRKTDTQIELKIKALQDISKELNNSQINRNPLNFGFKELLRSYFDKKHPIISKKKQLLDKAFDKVTQETEIAFIMKKLHEVEKLKKILLNPTQLTIFNLMPPPLISLDNNEMEINEEPKEFIDYLEYYNTYLELKKCEDRISRVMLTELDHRALKIFEKVQDIINEGYSLTKVNGKFQFCRNTLHYNDQTQNIQENQDDSNNNNQPFDQESVFECLSSFEDIVEEKKIPKIDNYRSSIKIIIDDTKQNRSISSPFPADLKSIIIENKNMIL